MNLMNITDLLNPETTANQLPPPPSTANQLPPPPSDGELFARFCEYNRYKKTLAEIMEEPGINRTLAQHSFHDIANRKNLNQAGIDFRTKIFNKPNVTARFLLKNNYIPHKYPGEIKITDQFIQNMRNSNVHVPQEFRNKFYTGRA